MYLLFDIGGTKMRIATSHDGETFSDPVVEKTPQDFDEGMRLFADIVHKIKGGNTIEAAAGDAPGPFNKERSILQGAPNLPGWIGKPLKKEIENITKAPVYLENDSALVGLGEAIYGAGRGNDIAVYITISTGVGGVRIDNGFIDANAMGFEPGHQIIEGGKTLQDLVSGKVLTGSCDGGPDGLDDLNGVWDKAAHHLAYGLNNTIVFWSPDIIVLGGAVMLHCISLDKVISHLKEKLTIFPTLPRIVKAELGDFGGLYGALALIKQKK